MKCHCHLSWIQEVDFCLRCPFTQSSLRIQSCWTTTQFFFFYQRDDSLKLMLLWDLNQLSACLNMVTWVRMYKDKKKVDQLCLSWSQCYLGLQNWVPWTVICQLSPQHTFFKPVSTFSFIMKGPVVLEKRNVAKHRGYVFEALVMPTSCYNHQGSFTYLLMTLAKLP